MLRPEPLALALLLAATGARAEELDADLLAFLADEAADAQQAAGNETAPANYEMVAWLQDWWTPAGAATAPQPAEEESP